MSQAHDHELSLGERALLHFHLAICRDCRAVNAQFAFLRRAVRSPLHETPNRQGR